MKVEPDLGVFQAGSDGLQYYNMEIGSPAVDEKVLVKIDYQKPDDTLSVESFPVQPSAPITEEASGRAGIDTMALVPWFLGALGVILVVGGIWWYWVSGRATPAPPPKRTSRGRRSSATSEEDRGEATYCHQCGKRAAAGDRFCRSCGTRLRTG
jgi:hypothetical protein